MSDNTDVRARLLSLIDELHVRALILDEEGAIAFITASACRLLDLTAEEAIGRRILPLSHHTDTTRSPPPHEPRQACDAPPLIAVNLVLRIADGQATATGRDGVTKKPHANHALEIDEITAALKQAHGNRSLAAKRLGISRTTLYRRLASANPARPSSG